jgi:hypothetical protein
MLPTKEVARKNILSLRPIYKCTFAGITKVGAGWGVLVATEVVGDLSCRDCLLLAVFLGHLLVTYSWALESGSRKKLLLAWRLLWELMVTLVAQH